MRHFRLAKHVRYCYNILFGKPYLLQRVSNSIPACSVLFVDTLQPSRMCLVADLFYVMLITLMFSRRRLQDYFWLVSRPSLRESTTSGRGPPPPTLPDPLRSTNGLFKPFPVE